MIAPSLRARLRGGLVGLAVVVAVLALLATSALGRLGNAVSTILRENYQSVLYCNRMQEALEREDSAALFAAAGQREIAARLLSDHRVAFRKALKDEAGNVTLPGEGDLVRRLEKDYGDYERAVDRVLALPEGAQTKAYFDDLLPRFSALKAVVREIGAMNQAHMEEADRQAKRLSSRTLQLATLIGSLVVFFAVWLAVWLPRVLIRPVDELSRAAHQIGEGNLEVAVPETEIRELSTLADAFRLMLERLRAYRASSLGELLAAKDLANSTVSCMLDPVVVFGVGGEILLTNQAAERAFGLQPGTAEELRSLEVEVPEALAQARDLVLGRKEAALPQTLSEAMRWVGAEGERFYLVRAAPLQSEDEVTGAVVLAQDVTRFRRIDELKSDVVATVSHQFKTPLTSLRMATHMLLEPNVGALSEAQTELVTTARDETERLRAMVDELLDLVRIEAEAGTIKRRPVDARALLSSVADAHRSVAQAKGVALDALVSEGLPSFEGDAERLSIVLSNLVSNAIRHTRSGGSVTLLARGSNGRVELAVRDTGEGIPESEQRRIFERAVTLANEPARDRHGLGLTIAREIAVQHGGDIRVQSQPGAGSEFVVSLPRT